MGRSWTENLRCGNCGKTGQAQLTEISIFEIGFDHVPAGFKVVTNRYGRDIHCDTCDIPVAA